MTTDVFIYYNVVAAIVLLTTTDTGPAIPPEFKEKIFKRLPNINIHQLLLTLRVRTGKLMGRIVSSGTSTRMATWARAPTVRRTVAACACSATKKDGCVCGHHPTNRL